MQDLRFRRFMFLSTLAHGCWVAGFSGFNLGLRAMMDVMDEYAQHVRKGVAQNCAWLVHKVLSPKPLSP